MESTLLTGACLIHGATKSKVLGQDTPNEKLNLACIGVGGRGAANVNGVSGQNLVAFVDVDEKRAAPS